MLHLATELTYSKLVGGTRNSNLRCRVGTLIAFVQVIIAETSG